jgi:hypothetical protein
MSASLFEPENDGPLPPPIELAKKHAEEVSNSHREESKRGKLTNPNIIGSKTAEIIESKNERPVFSGSNQFKKERSDNMFQFEDTSQLSNPK